MYDTVSAILKEPPPGLSDSRLWPRERSSVDQETGEIHRTMMLNTGHGLLLTLHDDGALQAERSLPKALRGQNVDDLTQGEVGGALAVVDGEIAEALGSGLPSFGTWTPCRVDYCQNVHLADEAAVLRALDKLAGVELPYKGLPVRGQHHSVTWPKGAIRPKVYGKFLETKGDPRALGVLRFESGVFKARSFRTLMDVAPPTPTPIRRPLLANEHLAFAADRMSGRSAVGDAAPKTPADLTVAGVLTPEHHAVVLGRYVERLRGDLMSEKEISDLDFMRELVGFVGYRRAATITGWCLLYALYGVQSRADLLASDVGHLATRYRVLADIRGFYDYLRAKGLEPASTESEDDAMSELIVHLGRLGKAA